MLKIAVIGAGFIGSVHAKNVALHPATQLVAVSDVNLEAARKLAATTGAKAVADAADIFSDKEVEAIFICTSTNTHVDYLKRSAQAGKAVYCEKPIGLDYQEAAEAVRVVRATKVPAMLGFNRRFDPNHAALQEAVRSGEVGKLEIIQMTSRGPSLPAISYLATSGGQLKDQTIHFFDLLRWITGDEAQEVYAIGAAMVDPKVAEVGDVDTSIAAIRMASGALCQIDSARRTGYGYDERIEVFGSKGMVESRRQRVRGVSRYLGDKVIDDGLHPGWFERIEQSYYRILDAFAETVAKGTEPSPSLEDGLKAQLLADKATESLKSGKPVKIDG
ncbi:MAG TPA: inositol 2-dehydrogenase [Terrimicrobiaceae bacterium]|nr:inositol 2-dehydrogenase [Terrimicrobiaceae bacterium]